jgi:hypothetical protein
MAGMYFTDENHYPEPYGQYQYPMQTQSLGIQEHEHPLNAPGQYASAWISPNDQRPWNSQQPTAGPWVLGPRSDQHAAYEDNEPYTIRDCAWTPSANSQEGYWTSGESSAMTSQTSFDPERDNMTESHATLRPPSTEDARSSSQRRPSPDSTNSSRSYFCRRPEHTSPSR